MVSELDKRQHQPQVTGDRRLAGGDDHKVSVSGAADASQLLGVARDRVRGLIARVAERLADLGERACSMLERLLESRLELAERVGERFAHRPSAIRSLPRRGFPEASPVFLTPTKI